MESKHRLSRMIGENNEKIGEGGLRLFLKFKGRELAANVLGFPANDNPQKTECHVAHLEDGITGEPVELTPEIRLAFARLYKSECDKVKE